MKHSLALLTILSFVFASGCGADRATHRTTLKKQSLRSVDNDEVRKEISASLEEAVASHAFDGMHRSEIKALFGRGQDCPPNPFCAEKGFHPTDWWYELGMAAEGYDKQLPMVIFGFDHGGYVNRVWNLRTE